ncbi:hypothetical protein BH18THE2_BH18THE2_21780 [soil metagenome]
MKKIVCRDRYKTDTKKEQDRRFILKIAANIRRYYILFIYLKLQRRRLR